jgi:hypothetical protein
LAYEERYADYEVYDRDGQRLGRVDTLFLDEDDRPEYLGVKMGLLGTRSTLLPWAAVTRADEEGGRLEFRWTRRRPRTGPPSRTTRRSRRGWNARSTVITGSSRRPGLVTAAPTAPTTRTPSEPARPPARAISARRRAAPQQAGWANTIAGARARARVCATPEAPTKPRTRSGCRGSEEELVAGTREREAGTLRIRKRVRTERERLEVPIRREEVHVERVPVSRRFPRPR